MKYETCNHCEKQPTQAYATYCNGCIEAMTMEAELTFLSPTWLNQTLQMAVAE
jgi:hypothetical protein